MSRPCTDRMTFAVRATPAGKFVDDLIAEAYERNDPRCRTACKGGSIIEQIWAALHHADEIEQGEQRRAAQKPIDDWAAKNGVEGLTGSVKIGGEQVVEVGEKTLENVTPIPVDMQPHIGAIFRERDMLRDEYQASIEAGAGEFGIAFAAAMKANPDAPKWPTLNAIILPKAIENVRERLKSKQEA